MFSFAGFWFSCILWLGGSFLSQYLLSYSETYTKILCADKIIGSFNLETEFFLLLFDFVLFRTKLACFLMALFIKAWVKCSTTDSVLFRATWIVPVNVVHNMETEAEKGTWDLTLSWMLCPMPFPVAVKKINEELQRPTVEGTALF